MHARTHTCTDLGEGNPWKKAFWVLSSKLPHPSYFLTSPSAASHPAPCTSVRKLHNHNPLGAANQRWPKITQSSEGSSDQKPSPPPQAGRLKSPHPRVLVPDRAFLSFGSEAPRETERDNSPHRPMLLLENNKGLLHLPREVALASSLDMRDPSVTHQDLGRLGQSTLSYGKPFFCLFVFCFETHFLCSPGCSGTCSVDQAGLQLKDPPSSAS